MLPRAVRIQRADGQHDMGMGVMTVCVMDGNIGAHALRHKLPSYEIGEEQDPFRFVQLYRQGDHELPRQSAVLRFLVFLHGVP